MQIQYACCTSSQFVLVGSTALEDVGASTVLGASSAAGGAAMRATLRQASSDIWRCRLWFLRPGILIISSCIHPSILMLTAS